MHEALGFSPQHHIQQSIVAHACIPSTREVEERVQSHPHLHSKFKASLGYVRLCQKKAVAEEEGGHRWREEKRRDGNVFNACLTQRAHV